MKKCIQLFKNTRKPGFTRDVIIKLLTSDKFLLKSLFLLCAVFLIGGWSSTFAQTSALPPDPVAPTDPAPTAPTAPAPIAPASPAPTAPPSPTMGFDNPLGEGMTLYAFLIKILNVVVFVLFPVVILMIVYTGFLFVVAQGNESKITQARTALFWTVIGVLVLLGSKALALAICETVKSIDDTVVKCDW